MCTYVFIPHVTVALGPVMYEPLACCWPAGKLYIVKYKDFRYSFPVNLLAYCKCKESC